MTRSPLPAGHVLADRFEIIEYVDGGGFGLTYRAADRSRPGAEVAVKECYPLAADDRARGADGALVPALASPIVNGVLAEGMAQLGAEHHPAIVRVVHVFPANGTAYVAMDWIDGDTLYAGLHSLPRDEPYLRKLYLTLLDAILYIAKQGFTHRDLSARNIMIRRADGEPVIIDFGASRPVGDDPAFATRATAATRGFDPPELHTRHGHQGIWTDLFGISASLYYFICHDTPMPEHAELSASGPRASLTARKASGEESVRDYSDALLDIIDRGLAPDIEQRSRVPSEALARLGIAPAQLAEILHPEIARQTSLLAPPPAKLAPVGAHYRASYLDGKKVFGYQRTLLQSFDTARFQPTSTMRLDGHPLTVDRGVKIALARTEALLSVAFGREIVVPAGQVAESPALKAIFTEIAAPYLELEGQIRDACAQLGMDTWRPFRLALERASDRDYLGFLRNYKYTGAPLVLLRASGNGSDDGRGKQLQALVALFANGQFDQLEKALGVPGYGEFAKRARSYFDRDKSVYATRGAAQVDTTDYVEVFRGRLGDERVIGNGSTEARASLDVVTEIESLLTQTQSLGLRGNWYLFASKFREVWPLARAFLDMRLFLGLARQYRVEHPVLISQEFEYGRFDHSLYLGPKVAAEFDTGRRDDDKLIRLAAHLASPIAWRAVLELYTHPMFLRSIRRMNAAFYFGAEIDYQDAVECHGILLDKWLSDILAIDWTQGKLVVRARGQASGDGLAIDSYEMSLAGQTEQSEASQRAEAVLAPFGGALPAERVGAHALCTRPDGTPAIGSEMTSAVLHYFVKPYRLLAGSHHD